MRSPGIRAGAAAVLLLLVGALLAAAPRAVEASQAYPVERTFTQSDGTAVRLQLWGDEFASGWRTRDGHSVVRNSRSGAWEYAVRNRAGALVPSGVAVGSGTPPAPPRLRPSRGYLRSSAMAAASPTFSSVRALTAPAWAGSDTDLLFLVVDFSDLACTFTDTDFQASLFGGGATGPGDLDDFFREVSYGGLQLDGLVEGGSAGCYRLANTHDHYDEGPGSAPALVREAVLLADADVDFSRFDNDGDGYVDAVGIIYAGGGAHDGCENDTSPAPNNYLWPHSWDLNSGGVGEVTVDGVRVNHYIVQSELTWALADGICDERQTIGLFAHEFGHALGLPDLYDTDGSSEGVGFWSSMASQFRSTVVLADTPPHYDPWSKWLMGWVTPQDRTGFTGNGPIDQVEDSGFVVRILDNPAGPERGGTGEYFLVENRQRVGFDSALPGCGLLVWHVDEAMTNNTLEGHTAAAHRLVDLEEADGLDELDIVQIPGDRGDAGDPYPGSTANRTFDGTSYPTSNLYSGTPSGVSLTDVSDCGAVMYANFNNPAADLALSKSDSPDPVLAGNLLTYTLTVVNHGPATATNVTVTDVLPPGVEYRSDTDTCSEAPAGTLTCQLGTLPSSQTASFRIIVAVDPALLAAGGVPAGLVNGAGVAADQADGNLSNNTASATTVALEQADLRTSKDCKPDAPLPAGATAVCTMTVENLGPSVARDVTLADRHVSDGTFSFGTVATTAGVCGATANPQAGSGAVTCTLGDIAPGATVTVAVPVGADTPQNINDRAVASSPTPDPNEADNVAEDSVTVAGMADLSLAKGAAPDPVVAGTQITWTVEVTNLGPSPAVGVVLSDRVPAGVEMVSVSAPSGSCNAGVPGDAARPATCTFDTLATGAARTMTIVATVLPGTTGLLHNDASASSATQDPDNANNLATTDTAVAAEADLVVEKTDTPDPVTAGATLTYLVVVRNDGPSDARAVRIHDALPGEVAFLRAQILTGAGACELLAPNHFTCAFGGLASGESAEVAVDVHVDASIPAGAVIVNTVTAESDTTDPDASNNTATAQTGVVTAADLALSKDGNLDATNPSRHVVYTLTVVNNGLSDAQDVQLVDPLPLRPKKVRYVFDTGDGACAYDLGSHRLTCGFGTLETGTSRTVRLYVDVVGSVRVVSNTATVSSSTPDPLPANNTARKDVVVKGGTHK